MPRYAVLSPDNVVINIVLADSLEDAELATNYSCVQSDFSEDPSVLHANIGYIWDGSVFTNPVVVE